MKIAETLKGLLSSHFRQLRAILSALQLVPPSTSPQQADSIIYVWSVPCPGPMLQVPPPFISSAPGIQGTLQILQARQAPTTSPMMNPKKAPQMESSKSSVAILGHLRVLWSRRYSWQGRVRCQRLWCTCEAEWHLRMAVGSNEASVLLMKFLRFYYRISSLMVSLMSSGSMIIDSREQSVRDQPSPESESSREEMERKSNGWEWAIIIQQDC